MFKSAIAATLVSGGALLAGWALLTGWTTVGFAGLTVGMPATSERAIEPAEEERVVTGSIPQEPRGQGASAIEAALEAGAGAYRLRWDSALLDPNPIVPPPLAPAAEPLPAENTGAVEPDEGTEASAAAIPVPPARPQSEAPRPAQAAAPQAREIRTTPRRQTRDTFEGPFTNRHIDQIRQRLNLTADQHEYWRPVEAALRNLVRQQQQARGSGAAASRVQTQELYWAAGPLLMRLRADQKDAARQMARQLGLETVASLI